MSKSYLRSNSGSRSRSGSLTLNNIAAETSRSSGSGSSSEAVVTIPEASPQALEYLQSVVSDLSELLPQVTFDDHLVTVSDTGKELGDFSIAIERVQRHGEPCFLVHANSKGIVDAVPCGTSIICYVSADTLDTIEQHHHEFVKLERQSLDRKTTIIRDYEGYVINKVITRGTDMTTLNNTYSLDTMKGFISEGSNLLLQRIFIIKGLPEELQFISLDSEDMLCPSVYRPLAERSQTVDEVELHVRGLERTIDSKIDFPITWQSYFTEKGHLANRVQVGSPVTMTLQELPRKDWEKPNKPVFEKRELNWEEDLQMFSAFLDRKEELKNSHMVFLRHHPELKALLADFMQFLLLSKPQDALAFSADYFAAFSTNIRPTPRYHASAIPPLFPHCRTNTLIEQLRLQSLEKN
ncbi:hypothetical protein ACOMHN_023420 [Nucella lapillus]